MILNWSEILERSPEFSELRANVGSIVENEKVPWFEPWLFKATIFEDAIKKTAARLNLDRGTARHGLHGTFGPLSHA